jgi:cytochrome c oxidase assembly protein subunit 11
MRTETKLTILAVAMFGFGYALVPLYEVFCEITGLNGKTGTIANTEAVQLEVDKSRLVTVEFDTNVNNELPWSFHVQAHKMKVHPGALNDVVFIIENNSDQPVVAQAVPSVAPAQASLFFNKTECFCFTQQMLAPRERKEMKVRFVVDPGLPKKISTLTLSYTYFMAPGSDKIVQKPDIVDEERI